MALVTGGTSGVGLSIVKALIQEDYYVAFIGINNNKGKELELSFNTNNSKCAEFICLDLSNLNGVYHFANEFTHRYSRLDLLVNVAGVVLPKREITEEGFERTFAIGYLSQFILSLKLKTLLKKSDGARIVNVSGPAKAVLNAKLDFDDLDFSKTYNSFKTSLMTVHAKTVLTEILAQKFVVNAIDVNSFHPGMVRSDLTRNLPFTIRILTKAISPFMSKISKNGIFVSSSQKLKGSSGLFYVNKKSIKLSFDSTYKETLWLKTNELLGKLKFDFNENS